MLSVTNFTNTARSIATFKIGYAKGVAIALNVSSSYVLVTSVTATKRRELLIALLSSAVKLIVTYTVKVPSGTNAAALQVKLTKAQANGDLDTALKSTESQILSQLRVPIQI